MRLPLRVRLLNFFRRIWMVGPLESWLAKHTIGKAPDNFLCKLVPNPYQYPRPSFRAVERSGVRMKVDVSDYMGHYFYFGFDDPSNQALFSLVKETTRIVDVGANIGWTALWMAAHAKNGWVMAFEPDAVNYQRCMENIRLNGFRNIQLFQTALGNRTDEVKMEVRTSWNLGGNRVAPGNATGNPAVVNRLDGVLNQFPDQNIELIKIDVEGYELEVLRGAAQLLERAKPVLFIELDDNNLRDHGSSAADLVRFLETKGYASIVEAVNRVPVSSAQSFENCHIDIIAS